MKKRFLLAVLLIFSISLMTPASATVPEGPYYYWGTGGTVVVEHPDFGLLMIRAANIKHSSPIPPHDLLTIYIWIDDDLDMWWPLAIITDHALCEELGDLVFAGVVDVTLVDENDLEVWSRFKVVLKVPVAGIHPFEVRFKDQGRGEWMPEEVTTMPYSGYTIRQVYKACDATATVTGPDGCELPVVEAWLYHPWEMLITPPPS